MNKFHRSIEIVTSIREERKRKLSYPDPEKLAKIEEDYQKAITNLNKQIADEEKIKLFIASKTYQKKISIFFTN